MIFVTGGSGFLGSYILQELVRQGKPVRAMYRKNRLPDYIPGNISEKISWVEGDILDVGGLAENLAGCTQIIHAAGMVSFIPSDKKKLFKINIEGTANMVNAAIEAGIDDFLHVSSVGALGRKEGKEFISENNQWPGTAGQSNYGISKYYGEMEVWRGMGEGLNTLIVNPTVILGYGNWNETSCGLFKTMHGEFPWYTNGTNGFVDVRDSALAVVSLLDSSIRNERFIICAENRSYREIFNYMAKGFGKKPPAKEATPFLSSLAWRIEKIKSSFSGQKPLVTSESVSISTKQSSYSNQKLLNALPGFRFRTMEDSISEACIKYASGLKPEA